MKIIGLSGHKRNGKNTCYMMAKLLLDEDETGYVTRIGFADAVKSMARENYKWDGKKDEHGRKLLQNIGMQMRQKDPGYWVDIVVEKILYDYILRDGVCFITDVRFKNEMDSIHALGGMVWRVNRLGYESTDNHPSEVDLDGCMFDYTINASTLDKLMEDVRFGLAYIGEQVPA